MAVVEEHTWAPPWTITPNPPDMADREKFKQRLGWGGTFTDFIADGKWDVDDVLRPIYDEASQALGREFEYPEKN